MFVKASAPATTVTTAPELRGREFRMFQGFILKEAGVTLPPTKGALVRGRLTRRLTARNLSSFADYYELIQRDPAERQEAINLLTTNETYFFREPKHFDFLRDVVLPSLDDERGFSAWSAACSSGEEVYSLAMLLADVRGKRPWSILGSDLSTRVLQKARMGHYSLNRTDGIPRNYLQTYCLKGKGSQLGTLLVMRELRERTSFQQINLNSRLPAIGPFDVVFLRNVMIYFSSDTKAEVVARIAEKIKPGGYLFIGHSESLQGCNPGLRLVRPSVYQKPE